MIDKLIQEMALLSEVEAIALGGSRARGDNDVLSDYDVYVYLKEELVEGKRRQLLDKYCNYMEYSNRFWELEDDGVLNNGVEIEFIYRTYDEIKSMVDNVVEGNVGHGYTTCFIDNISSMKILIDKTNRVTNFQQEVMSLNLGVVTESIVEYNFPILRDKMPSMYNQIKKAIKRNDRHSINHRVTAFFEMYYDILFAINEKSHPGEKRLLENSLLLKKVPFNHEINVGKVFDKMFIDNEGMLKAVEDLSNNLKKLITETL